MGNEIPNVAFQPTGETSWLPTKPNLDILDQDVAAASFSEEYSFGNSPHVVRCRSCGQDEYLMREHCRCGGFMRGQMDTQLWDWIVATKLKLKKKERQTTIYANLLMLASLLPGSVLAGLYGVLSMSTFEVLHPIAFVLFNGCLVISAALFRHSKKIARKHDTLGWTDFLASEFPPRSEAEVQRVRWFR